MEPMYKVSWYYHPTTRAFFHD